MSVSKELVDYIYDEIKEKEYYLYLPIGEQSNRIAKTHYFSKISNVNCGYIDFSYVFEKFIKDLINDYLEKRLTTKDEFTEAIINVANAVQKNVNYVFEELRLLVSRHSWYFWFGSNRFNYKKIMDLHDDINRSPELLRQFLKTADSIFNDADISWAEKTELLPHMSYNNLQNG